LCCRRTLLASQGFEKARAEGAKRMHRLQVSVLALVAAILPLLGCQAHWRLTKPVPRSGGVYENDPLPAHANTEEAWVCRHAHPNPDVERPVIAAGSATGIVYGTGAIGHAGDCSVYISYDTARPRRTMRWVKIANLPDCRSQVNEEVHIDVPSVLPAGEAVLRWDQYALHQVANDPPFIEWFIQCADIVISSSSTRSWESFNSFSIIDNSGVPVYPSSVSSYRSPYNPNQVAPGSSEFWMTGPACVDDSHNQCALTAAGTKGYTGFGGEGSLTPPAATTFGPYLTPTPTTPSPSPTETTLALYPTFAPTQAPSSSGGDAMCCYDAGCISYGTSFCSAVGTWCSGSAEACASCGGTLCVESAESAPVSVPTSPPPTPSPTSAPEGGDQCCYASGCSSYGTASCNAAGSWCSESAEACTRCGGTLCSGVSALFEERARRQKFLRRQGAFGQVLLQTDVNSRKTFEVQSADGFKDDEL